MHIVVIGTRGIPEIQGGVETHCQELYPRIVALGHKVTIIRRTPYISDDNRISSYKGVDLIDVYAPRKKSLEAIIHTLLAIIRARSLNPDILHIHAIGPAIMTPLARLLGMKVVMTNHGPDYDRQKWGRIAKLMLRTGEQLGTRFSNNVITISQTIADILAKKYNRTDTRIIFNGVETPTPDTDTDYLNSISLQPHKYIVAVGRFVKEKAFHDLIQAYARLPLNTRYKLAIAGDADHPDQYSSHLKQLAAQTPGVVLTGFIRGHKMAQLMSNATLFVIPSYHEGLPFSLLEAMSYGLPVIASDIPANLLPQLLPTDHFPVGNIQALTDLIQEKLSNPTTPAYDLTPYDWDTIAGQTIQLYRDTIAPHRR